MKIIKTHHFEKRLKERVDFPEEIMKSFKEMTKLVSKKKWHPYHKSKQEDKSTLYCVHYHAVNYIYTKKRGKYTLITFYPNTPNKKTSR